MTVTVVLLTKNGGKLLEQCLRAVLAQRFDAGYEVLVIDSGSTDGSAELLRAEPRIRLIEIGPDEFQHGRTRNRAMSGARGELVAFLTQDAVPVGDGWLRAHAAFMDAHPRVAGAFGHQVPHPQDDPLEAWEVSSHFASFHAGPEEFRPASPAPEDVAARARVHYFSNVNSCIRRAAWEQVPFPEIDFGEDQAWAREVQAAGWATGYARDAVVRHSHNYKALTLLRRRYDEARFMQRQFGYSLVPSWAEAVRAARWLQAAYGEHLRSLPEFGPSRRRRAAVRAWASTLGRFAGTRLAARDGALHAWLSLAERDRRRR